MLRSTVNEADAGEAATPRKLPEPRVGVMPLAPAAAMPPGAPHIVAVPPPPLTPATFLSGSPEARLRDLLAFAMAVEAGKPANSEDLETLRRRAEADLQAHAFRTLHNQAQTIRQEAVLEHFANLRPPLRFGGALLASLLALGIAAAIGIVAWPYRGMAGL